MQIVGAIGAFLVLWFFARRLDKLIALLTQIRDDPDRPTHKQLEAAKTILREIRDEARNAEAQRLYEKTPGNGAPPSPPKRSGPIILG